MTPQLPPTRTMGFAGFARRPVAAVILLAALAACQDEERPLLSLEEAKQATASFAGRAFVPPPKTIADITAILDKEKLVDPAAAGAARKAARREPTPTADEADLVRFYWKWGFAAGKIGRVRRQIADLKRAARLAKKIDDGDRRDLLWDLAVAESMGGNFADSLRHR